MTTLQAQLRDLIAGTFNDNEVRDLCFDFNIPYEDLGGEGKTAKVRELVAYCQSRNSWNDLITHCRELRPNIAWPEATMLAAAAASPTVQPVATPAVTVPSAPPLELTIRFERMGDTEDAPLAVNVSIINHTAASDSVPFTIPLNQNVLADLRWYLEVYPQWPVGPDYDRALKIEADLQKWGKTLFEAAFSTPKLMRVFEQFRLRDGGKSITIDSTDSRVLQLPWELLADEGGYLFTQRPPISLRRKLRVSRERLIQPFQLPVRILFVVSRPEGAGFLDPRSSRWAIKSW